MTPPSPQTTVRTSQGLPSFERPRAIDTIVYGGLVAGLLDVLDAFAISGLQGRSPIELLQYIASGALGPDAFAGGYGTAALGTAFHFLIAFLTGAVFYEASRLLPVLYKRPAVWGPVFGVGVYFFMNYAVLPFSSVPRGPFSIALLLNGVIGHAVLVGLPIALFASKSAHSHRKTI
ncbi:MAG: hypothetical protein ABR941_05795 [Thermoleophilia bacterium]